MRPHADRIRSSQGRRQSGVHDGVTFEETRHVLLDPSALTREDMDAGGEQRFVTLGMGGQSRRGGVDASRRWHSFDLRLES